MIRTVTTVSRKLLADTALPARFRPFAFHHAASLYNPMAHSGAFVYHFSPHAAFYGNPPYSHHPHPFGTLMSYKLLPAQVGIFLGFSSSDPTSDTLVRSVSTRTIIYWL